MPRSLGLRGAGTGLRAGLRVGRCGRGVLRPYSPSLEPPPYSPESECYIKSGVGAPHDVALVVLAQPPGLPVALDAE